LTGFVRPLAELDAGGVDVAGGKGANLADLVRAGFPVPDGFVLTTTAYSLAAKAAGVDPHDPADARTRLLHATVPADIATAVRVAYRAIGAGRVAVRSSATAEDRSDASFAGQQDTILGVEGEDAVVDAVRRCWASLFNDRAVAYRATLGIDERAVLLAVVVQRMVDADVAGVLFTADPLTGTRGRAAINAVRGLAEQLVSGAVNPDYFLVDTRHRRVLERRGEVLGDARLLELAALGARVEAHFGRPQDIEWAIDWDTTLWLVQSRDITTLYPLPTSAPSDPDRDLRVYFSANVAQGVFEPFTPMGMQTFRLLGSSFATAFGSRPPVPTAGVSLTVEAAMRLFLDLTPLLRNPALRELPGRVMSVMEARSARVFERLLEDPRLAPRPGSSRARSAFAALRLIARTGAPRVAIRALLRPAQARQRLLREVDAFVEMDLGRLDTSAQRIDAFQRLLLTWPPRAFPRLAAMALAGLVSYTAARRLLGPAAREDELRTVLRGLPLNPTTEMDLELWALSRRVRNDPPSRQVLAGRSPGQLSGDYRANTLPPVLQREVSVFLERYGHRAIAEIDLGLPRWAEDPAHLLGAVANYQRLDDAAVAPDAQFARGAQEAEAAIATVLARVHGPRRALAAAFLRRVRLLTGLREMPKFQVIRVFARGRAILAPVGVELASAGRIAKADDLWFLTLPDTRRALAGDDMRTLVAARRGEYAHELKRRRIPRVLLSDGTDAEVAYVPPVTEGALRGTPASPGVSEGIARVIRSPAGARLDPGEVLVAPSTDPGWTPLFLTASALVMEMGGMMSHGAVVAREYGIPAVVGVPDATERIRTGEHVVVDGSAGTVALESRNGPRVQSGDG
jgi:phosphohistidine swiveling domain-containing protein